MSNNSKSENEICINWVKTAKSKKDQRTTMHGSGVVFCFEASLRLLVLIVMRIFGNFTDDQHEKERQKLCNAPSLANEKKQIISINSNEQLFTDPGIVSKIR